MFKFLKTREREREGEREREEGREGERERGTGRGMIFRNPGNHCFSQIRLHMGHLSHALSTCNPDKLSTTS